MSTSHSSSGKRRIGVPAERDLWPGDSEELAGIIFDPSRPRFADIGLFTLENDGSVRTVREPLPDNLADTITSTYLPGMQVGVTYGSFFGPDGRFDAIEVGAEVFDDPRIRHEIDVVAELEDTNTLTELVDALRNLANRLEHLAQQGYDRGIEGANKIEPLTLHRMQPPPPA